MNRNEIRESFKNTNAFYWVSFDPEKRLENFTNSFMSYLDSIEEECEKYGLPSGRFENKLYNLAMKYLGSQSRCMSWAITGPARFPVRSQEIRYNIYFDEIPPVEMRTKIKSLGFKWSPTRKAWTRNAKTISLENIKKIFE